MRDSLKKSVCESVIKEEENNNRRYNKRQERASERARERLLTGGLFVGFPMSVGIDKINLFYFHATSAAKIVNTSLYL